MKTGKSGQCQCSWSCKQRALDGEAFCAVHIKGCPIRSPLSSWEPKYDPNFWNSKSTLRQSHNCFSYAMNVNDKKQVENCNNSLNCNVGFHQPGSPAGHNGFTSSKPKTCSNMMIRLFGDQPDIKMVKFEERCPKKMSKIALVVDASADYHFLRQDSNQYWSQKSGARPVTDKDASGHRIWNPQLSDLDFRKNDSNLNYDIFCSYMCVPRTKALYMKVGGTRKKYSR